MNKASHSVSTGVLSLLVMQARREADSASPSSAKVINGWSYTSIPLHFFMACTGEILPLKKYEKLGGRDKTTNKQTNKQPIKRQNRWQQNFTCYHTHHRSRDDPRGVVRVSGAVRGSIGNRATYSTAIGRSDVHRLKTSSISTIVQ